MSCWIVQLVLSASGSFSALEPAVQAIVQATAKSVVRFPGVSLGMPAVLGLVESVPLLHATDYEHASTLPGAGSCYGLPQSAALVLARPTGRGQSEKAVMPPSKSSSHLLAPCRWCWLLKDRSI
jgi:hypothetical protein